MATWRTAWAKDSRFGRAESLGQTLIVISAKAENPLVCYYIKKIWRLAFAVRRYLGESGAEFITPVFPQMQIVMRTARFCETGQGQSLLQQREKDISQCGKPH